MIDRTIQPKISDISGLVVPEVRHEVLRNGMELHTFKAGSMPLVDLSFLVHAGKMDQTVPFQNTFTGDQLKSGAKGKTTNEVAEILDFYGAAIFSNPYFNSTEIKVTVMAHQLKNVIELIRDCLFFPAFDENELVRRKKQMRLRLEQNLKQPKYVAAQEESHLLLGDELWLRLENKLEDCDKVTVADLKRHHSSYYYPENIEIFLGGYISDDVVSLVKRTFEEVEPSGKERHKGEKPAAEPKEVQTKITQVGGVQSAVRMAAVCDKNNGEFPFLLRFVSFLLGGSLTSRLAPIREDFGYTYGIYSSAGVEGGYNVLRIYSNCDNKYAKPLVDEVYNQFARLQSEPITAEELQKAKNLYMGEMLDAGSVQTAWIDTLIGNVVQYEDSPRDFSYLLEQEIMCKKLTLQEVNDKCAEILKKGNFFEVVAGKPVGFK